VGVDHVVLGRAAGERGGVLVAQPERVEQQPPDGVRDPGLARLGVGDQLARSAQQVRVMPTSA
jgi:hypothetical protein